MGVRERLQLLRKVFGSAEPPEIAAAEEASGMTPSRPFSPGEPIGPYDGYSRHPRTREIITGYNINARPRAHERIPFDTLRSLIEAYDVAQMAIWHRIDSIRSLEWSLVAADGFEGDVADAITTGMSVLESPDRGESDFSAWLGAYLYDTLAYDAGTLYRIRNRAGQSVGLRTVDGTLIAPLQDYWGNTPKFPAEAYVQYANGLPWNWLTTRDLVYKPFRKINRSPYGQAPLETILLNANTDLRFQAFFLQYFTEGNIPAAFASAPETWSPQQIEQFQTYWDAFILGDQSAKSQIKWIPGGSHIEFTGQREFSDAFSLHLMRKTLAAFHVVPSDMGFTENVNKSSGETQSDVQHRIGDVPLAKHVSGIITGFLQNDLHLPVKHAFDFGEEQDDRLQTAQADKLYVEMGAVSSSDIRQLRYGLVEADGYVVPRFIFSTRGGPIPLGALDAVAGEIDPATAAPAQNAGQNRQVFQPVQGVVPVPPIEAAPLAVQEFGQAALPPAAPMPVGKEGVTAGITATTGIYSYDGPGERQTRAGGEDDEDDEQPGASHNSVTKAADAEIAAFRRHAKQSRRPGRWWRDFQFANVVDPITAHRLNDDGRLAWRKAAGRVAVAGLAVRAADTGRVLMLQRALVDDDPAGGCLEFPGGHIEGSETPVDAAVREWREETGLDLPDGDFTGEWTSGNGVYQGFVYIVASEDLLDIFDRDWGTNPDDPDGDQIEVVAWFDPDHLADNPTVRPELADDLNQVQSALDTIAKSAAPKADAPAKGAPQWPGWEHDDRAADHWAPIIAGALAGVLAAEGARLIAAGFLATRKQDPDDDRKTLIAAAVAYLLMQRLDLAGPLTEKLAGVYTDGYLIGTASAEAVLNGERIDLGAWKPGDTGVAETLITESGHSAGLDTLLDGAAETAAGIAETRVGNMARSLADATLAGVGADEAGQAIRDALADASRAEAVAVTEITRASGAGALSAYLQQGVTLGRWVTEGDRKVCPRCQGNAAVGPVPIGRPYPSGDFSSPAHTSCFPAGVVVAGPSVVAATTRPYEGDLVTIVFADGEEVPVTPNHPMLTSDGWVAAGNLYEGIELLRAPDADRIARLLCPDDSQAVSRIEDVAAALREAGPVVARAMPLAAEDFHGDGSGDDEVNVVLAAGHAEFDLVSAITQQVGEFGFIVASRQPGPTGGKFNEPFMGAGFARSLMRGCNQGGALLGTHMPPPHCHCGGSVSCVNTELAQHSTDGVPINAVPCTESLDGLASEVVLGKVGGGLVAPDDPTLLDPPGLNAVANEMLSEGLAADTAHTGALGNGFAAGVGVVCLSKGAGVHGLMSERQSSFSNVLPEGLPGDADNGRALLNRLAGLVGIDRVVEVRRQSGWTGHVYNLETVEGWYFANGIIAHNCRCAVLPA